jgi:hypothetical protein
MEGWERNDRSKFPDGKLKLVLNLITISNKLGKPRWEFEAVWPRKVGKLNSKHGKKSGICGELDVFGREMIDPI